MTNPLQTEGIIVVTGLPRSGTSMLMQMCEAGGNEVLSDHQRAADEDNPKGYYEFEQVKQLDKDQSWLTEAKGKVVKIISTLLKFLTLEYSYRVIFLHRDIEEIISSQERMIARRGEQGPGISREKLASMYRNHLEKVEKWLEERDNFKVLHISYNDILQKPLECSERINTFLGGRCDAAKMARVIDDSLYRQRNVRTGES